MRAFEGPVAEGFDNSIRCIREMARPGCASNPGFWYRVVRYVLHDGS